MIIIAIAYAVVMGVVMDFSVIDDVDSRCEVVCVGNIILMRMEVRIAVDVIFSVCMG